ncbi:retinoic acid receptor RXR-alpha-like [Callorhinchus milii]|uniref:retinoic acid receptor RXR-alpha-like n=1 Tax=Callorhinchus milii TaxID=7868 RepID=UPI001C3F7D5A|nr:retinoic acid receptor RXR-alpha-like [Callorhinchus milii]
MQIEAAAHGYYSSPPLNYPVNYVVPIRGMNAPSLHPQVLGPGVSPSLGSPTQLHSPVNGMTSPFSVISSSMGSHSMSVTSTSSMGYGGSSPQVSTAGEGRQLGRGGEEIGEGGRHVKDVGQGCRNVCCQDIYGL